MIQTSKLFVLKNLRQQKTFYFFIFTVTKSNFSTTCELIFKMELWLGVMVRVLE